MGDLTGELCRKGRKAGWVRRGKARASVAGEGFLCVGKGATLLFVKSMQKLLGEGGQDEFGGLLPLRAEGGMAGVA